MLINLWYLSGFIKKITKIKIILKISKIVSAFFVKEM